ncbi:MAG TPA: class I SAM-dependent methyltransferase [Vicinamibacterales bacterium]|nr:class I SAM-dependent methyltransferase [Vicinamibacterales bacterium]
MAEGWEGWDDYAPFYDWENAQTVGRRDVRFWQRLAAASPGPVLELGSGTGRVTFPLAKQGITVVGIDRSAAMLARAATRRRRLRTKASIQLVRGDIRYLPFEPRSFPLAIAPYGILQSLLREKDLAATLAAVAGVLSRGATFGLELVADLPSWKEYSKRVSLRGKRANGATVTLTESVRQDPQRKLTLFDQEFVERTGRHTRRRRFTLAFRTLSVPQMTRRLEKAGFEVTALLGDYRGGPWDPRADAWIILAKRV